jgi:hypothetical protein
MSGFLPRTLWYHTRDLKLERVAQGEVPGLSDCVVILGEPGMGKTSLLEDLAATPGAAICTARQLINRYDPRSLVGNAELLVVDALDEVPAAGEGDAVDRVLQKLGAAGYPRFVLSCRVADWRAATAVGAIREQYAAQPLELHLEPLTRDQQRTLLVRFTGKADRADALLDHFDRYQLDFLGNPQTLKLIAALPDDEELPRTSSRLLELATAQLRREHKPGNEELPATVALDTAGAAFAALLLTGSSRITSRTAIANLDDGELPFSEVQAIAGDQLERVIRTRLFSVSALGSTYVHRRIGEYLAARRLARWADTSGKRKRLLAMLRSDGRVPASLRGLHAWLALDANLAPDIIAADPMGVIEYGDADVLIPAHAKLLLAALERLSHDNPRFVGWSEYRASALVATPLQEEVRAVIADGSREFGLRKLLLDQLSGDTLTSELRDVLLVLLRDPDEIFSIRKRAGQVLLETDALDWPAELDAIRRQADRMSTRLAFELMNAGNIEAFSDVQIVEIVFAHDGLSLVPAVRGPSDRTIGRYWKFAHKLPPERLDNLLDLFAEYAKALLPRHAGIDENQLLDLLYELVLLRLAHGAPEPWRLWSWIEHFEGQRGYRRDRAEKLADWFRANDEARRAVQCFAMLPERDPKAFRMRAFELSDASPGLAISNDDAIALLDVLDPNDRRDERWREVLWFVRTSGDEGKPIREAAKRFASHRADLIEWVASLAEPQEPKWKRKQDEEARKRRSERAVAYADSRREFIENLSAVEHGEFRFIVGLARAYLNQYRDIGEDQLAHERIASWVGADVADAAHKGFEAFLQLTPPRPSALRIAISHAIGRRWNAADIVVAALAERLRTRAAPFEGVASERLMAGLFEIWRTCIDDHAKIEGLQEAIEIELRARGDVECALRMYIEPQLKKPTTHVDQLYALMRSDAYGRELPPRLAGEWLRRFPNLPAEPESELLDALLVAGRVDDIVPLIGNRLAGNFDDERRRNWDAVQVLVDFEAARDRLGAQPIEHALLWHLRTRGGGRGRDERGSARLSPEQISWIITTFRPLFPSHDHPSGTSSGDVNPWDATEYLRGLALRLGNDLSDESVAALKRLRNAPADGYTDAFKIYFAEQEQARAEQDYVPPTLSELETVIGAGPPTNAIDLQAVLLEALSEIQARLKGDPLDWYRNFFSDDGHHKREEPCRDALLQMLDGKLPGVSLRPEDHGADDKRVDIIAQIEPTVIVPIEVKGQWHRDLWTAADAQLEHLYVNDWRADRGIYLVLWFGEQAKLQAPPGEIAKPTSPDELKAVVEGMSKAAAKGRIAVVVLDLTRPQPL